MNAKELFNLGYSDSLSDFPHPRLGYDYNKDYLEGFNAGLDDLESYLEEMFSVENDE